MRQRTTSEELLIHLAARGWHEIRKGGHLFGDIVMQDENAWTIFEYSMGENKRIVGSGTGGIDNARAMAIDLFGDRQVPTRAVGKSRVAQELADAQQAREAREDEAREQARVDARETRQAERDTTKAKGRRAAVSKPSKKAKGPGVIETIIRQIAVPNADEVGAGSSVDEIVDALVRVFPERDAKGMRSTVKIQLKRWPAKHGIRCFTTLDSKRGTLYALPESVVIAKLRG